MDAEQLHRKGPAAMFVWYALLYAEPPRPDWWVSPRSTCRRGAWRPPSASPDAIHLARRERENASTAFLEPVKSRRYR
jgi:hypothetical protein